MIFRHRDQLFAPVADLILLLTIEVAPAVRKRQKEKKAFEDTMRKRIDQGINRRKAKLAARQSIDVLSQRNSDTDSADGEVGNLLDGDGIELDNLYLDDSDDEPDATLDFESLERAVMYEAFAASEEDIEAVGLGFEIGESESVGEAVGEDELDGDEMYMMSSALCRKRYKEYA